MVDRISETQRKVERESLEEDKSFFWVKSEGEIRLATINLIPGNQVYGERLVLKKGIEYRIWDPFRSKLAAAIMQKLEVFPFENKTRVLYLGASTGTTVSHISDIVGNNGIIFSVDHASRVARDFLDRVATFRSNIVPILQDARKPSEYFSVFGKVDVIYVDIAQPDQTEIAINNCKRFLKSRGFLFLVVKIHSISSTKPSKQVLTEEISKLEEFDILQHIDLYPYDRGHVMIVAQSVD